MGQQQRRQRLRRPHLRRRDYLRGGDKRWPQPTCRGLNPQSSLLDEEREKQRSTLLASLPAQTQPVQTEDGDTTAAPTVPAEATPPADPSVALGAIQAPSSGAQDGSVTGAVRRETVAAPIDDSAIHQTEAIQ
jgi:hypothetical protein